jgi:hypothetical protein
MKDLIDIIAESLRDRDDRNNILTLVESLYFTESKKPFWRRASPGSKESALIASDLVNLENSISSRSSIRDVTIRSQLINQLIDQAETEKMYEDIRIRDELTSDQQDFLKLEVIKTNRNYVTAVMVAELIRDEKSRTRAHQWLTILLPVCTAIITAVIARFWR